MFDENNFRFIIETREWVMRNGVLSVDNCEYEDVEEGGAEIYELARAYARLNKETNNG